MAVGKFTCDWENSSGSSWAKGIWYNSKLWEFPDLIQRSSDLTGLLVQRGSQEEQRSYFTLLTTAYLFSPSPSPLSSPRVFQEVLRVGLASCYSAKMRSYFCLEFFFFFYTFCFRNCPLTCCPHPPHTQTTISWAAAAAAKSLQSCPTLRNPIDGSPPGSPVPGILQARTLEWVAISFSDAWKWKVKGKLLSRVRLLSRAGTGISSRHLYFCNWASLSPLVGTEVPF